MCVKTSVDLRYIRGQRFFVEISLDGTKRRHYTKRIARRETADGVKARYDRLKGLSARVFDTKTGEII